MVLVRTFQLLKVQVEREKKMLLFFYGEEKRVVVLIVCHVIYTYKYIYMYLFATTFERWVCF